MEIYKREGEKGIITTITTSLPKEYLQDADVVCDSLDDVKDLILGDGCGVKVTQ